MNPLLRRGTARRLGIRTPNGPISASWYSSDPNHLPLGMFKATMYPWAKGRPA